MSSVIYTFLVDPAFTDRSTDLPSYIKDTGGIGNLSQVGLSYFIDLATLRDTRDPTSRVVNIPHDGNSTLLFDGEYNKDATNLLTSISKEVRDSIFALTDKVFFNSDPSSSTNDIDAALTKDPIISTIYVAKSLRLPETQVTGVYYDKTGKETNYSTWAYLICDLDISLGTTKVKQTFHIFSEDTSWKKNYPYSTIMSVTPCMSYRDLITLPLNTAQANELITATNVMNLAMANFSGPQSKRTATGGLVFSLNAVGPDNAWKVVTPWGILYKGQKPSVSAIRKAIKDAVEGSGVATPDEWKQRFPDLYIIGRFYLIPFWDMTYKMSDSVIYKGITKDNEKVTKVSNIFPAIDQNSLLDGIEYLESPYRLIQLASIKDTNMTTPLDDLNKLHPTYRSVDKDNPSFSYMDKATQEFSSNVIESLAIFSGASNDPTFIITVENGITYIPFSINEIEYVVISPDTYNEAQGVYQ